LGREILILVAVGDCGTPETLPQLGGTDRFTISITSKESGLSYHLHLSEAEAERFATFLAERIEVNPFNSIR
jgi:hypothetical protein